MASKAAEAFMDGLRRAEESHNPAPLVQLFADDAELENAVRNITTHGLDGARRFWQDYLGAFDHIKSDFTQISDGERFAALEWRSSGRSPDGTPISYRGVSLVEFDANEHVTRFCTYYDSAAFLPQGAKLQAQATNSS